CDDARADGVTLPSDPKERAAVISNHYPLGIESPPLDSPHELAVRVVFEVLPDGSVRLSAAVPEGSLVRIARLTPEGMRAAAIEAADSALDGAGGEGSGALVIGCSGRLGRLGDAFAEEIAVIKSKVGAPIGGACVFGEIAREKRAALAFFNT